ncbi:MAG: hypothetical protein P1U42_03805 [Phycisphaerales bacterium]|nr:hypothetical protein [Phycisphaerales bacterium]
MTRILLSTILTILLVSGCSKQTEVSKLTGTEVKVSDPNSNVTLDVRTNQSEITIADRVQVVMELRWPEGIDARITDTKWDTLGWTLIEVLNSPVTKSDESLFTASFSYTLEPFLPGQYSIPQIEAVIIDLETQSETRILTDPIELKVVGVLSVDDTGELTAPVGLFNPDEIPAPGETKSIGYLVAGIVGIILVISIVWIFRKSSHTSKPTQSIYQQLKSIAQSTNSNDAESYRRLYRAIIQLDHRLLQTSEFGTLVEQCEVAIYSQDGFSEHSPQAMAKHTLELLGSSEQETV